MDDLAIIVAVFVVGAVCGALITAAWLSDSGRVDNELDATEHGRRPL
jgi:hypothetical protein